MIEAMPICSIFRRIDPVLIIINTLILMRIPKLFRQ